VSKLNSFVGAVKSMAASLAVNLGIVSLPKIIDISYCQSIDSIDWAKLKQLGVGVIMRMGQNTWEDQLFRGHYANAIKYGVSFGVYWFYQPDCPPGPQVAAFLKVYNSLSVKPKVISLDVENISYWTPLLDADGHDVIGPDGKEVDVLINVLPPSAAIHSGWLYTWLTEIEKATGVVPGVYTRQDYWNAWTVASYAWDHFFLWIASWTNYSADIRMPRDWKVYTVWQYVGGTNRQDGVIGPVDGNYFNGDQAAMDKFFGNETYTTYIPVVVTPPVQTAPPATSAKATFVVLSSEDKNINMVGISEASMTVLRMAGQNGPEHANVYSDGAFPIRIEQAENMRAGWVTLSTNFQLWVRQMMYAPFCARKWYENETLKVLLQTWLKKPFKDQEWKIGLKLSGNPDLWHRIDALFFYMDGTKTDVGGSIGGIWQLAVLDDMLKNIKAFKDSGFIPDVPVYLLASTTFYQTYAKDEYWLTLCNRLENGFLSGIGIYETNDTKAYQDYLAETKKFTELFVEAPMKTPFDHVSQIFDYRPAASYKPTCVPFGFDPSFTIYSANRFVAEDAFYDGAALSPLMVGEWEKTEKDVRVELKLALGPVIIETPYIPPEEPPVIDPPVVDPPIIDPPVTTPVSTEAEELGKIEALLQLILDKLTAFIDWFKTK
jgi:GH25 family lysozyme M1 (1,4-beta-N-acetylmuramidase)